jgi:hypothetical protein
LRLSSEGVDVLAVRTVKDIDKDLDTLRNIIADSLRGGDKWNIAWERIDELLEERCKIVELN